ncbi:MAG: hypothetical protein CME83_06715 [Candidatus Heimdallarchaeota archaeon]|nr:hypothetical protein [Candidatus Heimdallarchaeota archaeon]|tara:strand:- start:329 stop:721 length:393 start_codon:yes stop_codon:yes gene_type:complete
MVDKDKLPNTIPLTIVQIINYLNIIGILCGAIFLLFVAEWLGFEWFLWFFIIIATIILLLIMRYFIRGLNRYDNQTKNIFLILLVIEAFIIINLMIDTYFEIFYPVLLIFTIFQIYALVYHKPTSDYFKS